MDIHFTKAEVETILTSLGYKKGTVQFMQQLSRRFVLVCGHDDLFIDHPTFAPNAEDKARAAAAREGRPFDPSEPMVGRIPGQNGRELYGRGWDPDTMTRRTLR